jgi:hypothetical protein
VNVLFLMLGLRPGTGYLLSSSSAFLLLWTLSPHDCVTYCQARGLSGHTSPCGECVCFNLEDSAPPEVEEDYLPFSWLDSKWAHFVHCKEIFDFELELLTSLWQALLGIHYSATVHNYSVTQYGGRTMSLTARLCSHLLRQAQDGVAQRIQGARGLAVEGMTLDTHGRLYGLCP